MAAAQNTRPADSIDDFLRLYAQNNQVAPPVKVRVHCVLEKLWDIDSEKQEFKAQLGLVAKWKTPVKTDTAGSQESSNAGSQDSDSGQEETDLDTSWHPQLVFDNALEVSTEEPRVEEKSEQGTSWSNSVILATGTFRAHMDLRHFPFDCQRLSITVRSELSKKHVDLVQSSEEESRHEIKPKDLHGWTLSHRVTAQRPAEPLALHFPGFSMSIRANEKPRLAFSVLATRRGTFFAWSIFLIQFLLMGLSFSSLAVGHEETGDRLATSITLLLTSTTFKFSVSHSSPTLEYPTLWDYYSIGCIMIQCAVVIENAASAKLGELCDLYAGPVIAGLALLFNIIFILTVSIKVCLRRRAERRADRDAASLWSRDDVNNNPNNSPLRSNQGGHSENRTQPQTEAQHMLNNQGGQQDRSSRSSSSERDSRL